MLKPSADVGNNALFAPSNIELVLVFINRFPTRCAFHSPPPSLWFKAKWLNYNTSRTIIDLEGVQGLDFLDDPCALVSRFLPGLDYTFSLDFFDDVSSEDVDVGDFVHDSSSFLDSVLISFLP